MENPATWTEVEKVIHKANQDFDEALRNKTVGRSRAKAIADALRAAGLIKE